MEKLFIIVLIIPILLSCVSQFRQEMRTQDAIMDLKRDVIREVVTKRALEESAPPINFFSP